jgi:glycosyltransferase involved in cell wall biosynthesis
MKLSIITCTYNSEKYLPASIESVVSQNQWIEYEHIFVDGMSNDSTCEIVRKYADENPSIHVVLEQRNPKGIYNAMNEGIKIATWDFILFLNSDDYLSENILSRYMKFVAENPDGDIYHAKFQKMHQWSNVGIFPNNIFLARMLFQIGFNTFVFHPTCLIKRSLFIELGLYDETKKIASDLWFWFLCLSKHKKFIFFPEVVSCFRVHEGSMTSNPVNKTREIDEVSYFRKKYLWKKWCIVDSMSRLFLRIKWFIAWKS